MRVSLKDLKAARARSRKSGRRHSPLAEAEAAIGQGVNAGIGEALSHVLRKREGLLIRGINVPLRKKRFFQGLEMSTSADIEFMRFGVQYYVAARYAALAGLLSVCGNLYHHALEMFLKAGLSRQLSLESLKSKKFRHKLIDIWNAFKVDFPSPELLQFDTTIADIDDFEK